MVSVDETYSLLTVNSAKATQTANTLDIEGGEYTPADIVDGFDIEFYQNSAEVNRVDKTDYLVGVGTLSGVLRDQCSMMTPSIVYRSDDVPNFNYVHIPIFNRYYFVVNITSVSKNLWRMDLNCDVLMSFKTQIYALSGVIGRQEYAFNGELEDNLATFENQPDISYVPFQPATNPFNVRDGELTTYNAVVTVVGGDENE